MSNYFDEYDVLLKDMAKLVRDIVAERERQGLSQGKLAEMAGIKQSAISRIENLSALPQLDTLLKILHPLSLKLVVEHKNNLEELSIMNIAKSGITALAAEVYSCRLKVGVSEDENFYFISDEEDEFITEQLGDKVSVRQKRHNNFLKNIFQMNLINAEVKLPKSFCGDINIVNKNGATHLLGLNFKKLVATSDNGKTKLENSTGVDIEVESDNGAIKLKNVTADTLSVKNDNGKITLSDLKISAGIVTKSDNGKTMVENAVANKFDISSDNGAIVLSNPCADSYNLNTKNGAIIADIGAAEEDFSMEISTKMGFAMVGGKKYHGSYIYKDKEKQKHITATTKNGTISITFSDTDPSLKENFTKSENEKSGFEEVFDFSGLANLGEMIKDSMKIAKIKIKNHIKEADDGTITVHSGDGKEKVVIINKNGKKTINIFDDDDEDEDDCDDEDDREDEVRPDYAVDNFDDEDDED